MLTIDWSTNSLFPMTKDNNQARPAKRDADATRAAILGAAQIEFLEHGLSGTTVSAIATRAGVTKSLIHHHFGSKLALWQDVKSGCMANHVEEQLAMLRTAAVDESLAVRSMAGYFRFLQNNPDVIRLLSWMFIERDQEDFGGAALELVDAGIRKFEEGQASGVIRPDLDPRLMLAAYLNLIQHWFQDREFIATRFDPATPADELDDAYLQTVLKIFIHGIRARET